MFQCIIQQKNGWIHPHNTENKDVFPDIRLQLNEQLRCLDLRMEGQVTLVTELQDFFRRRGELELDYSKNLDKLAKSLQLRHKEQKQKREQWPLFSSYSCWQQLVTQTKNLSRDHVALSEVYSSHLVSRLAQVMEDVQRIYKRCREIGYETHEEILRVLHELHTTMKTYHSYQAELRQADTKLKAAENQKMRLAQTLTQEKLGRSKKYKLTEKEVEKRSHKFTDAKLKALKARNEYILCLEASNTTIHKYFVDDLSDLIDCMDFGFHNCISRALLMHVSAEEGRQRSVQHGLDTLSACINSLDSRLDKQRFLEYNHSAFMIPKKLEFQGQKIEEPEEADIQKVLHQEMESRLGHLQERVTTLRAESEEVWKTLETAESSLLEMLNAKDYDCSGLFGDVLVPASKPLETVSIKLRADRQETEEFYLSKFREYLLGSTRIARLDAKQEHLRQTLQSENTETGNVVKVAAPRRRRIGRLQMSGQPKLFGGSLEEYLEAVNQDIPLVIKSCVRVINLYGLHHQGIFRVSGSQVEINNFREWFERGEDPLADMTDASDINSVAGVLKLYLRELREPLFPIIYFEQFMDLARLDLKPFVIRMRDLVNSFPRPVVIVLRYLFAFLNHLSEFSDENMMDPYNLAICFGPTLIPVPDDKDQVQYQNQVNDLIKNIIIYHDKIFLNDGGVVYEKYISPEPDDHDVGDSPSDHTQDDLDSEVYPSEDDSENMEATAQFDFIARSNRELTLKKGDVVTLYSQVSDDWWRGAVSGQEGLIPDKYISLKIKDDDRDKSDNLKLSSSEESMKRRVSSSNDSMLSESSISVTSSPLVRHAPPVAWQSNESQQQQQQHLTIPTTTTTEPSPLPTPTKTENSSALSATPVLLNQTRENGHNRYKSLDISIESYIFNKTDRDSTPVSPSPILLRKKLVDNSAAGSLNGGGEHNESPITSGNFRFHDRDTNSLELRRSLLKQKFFQVDESNLDFTKNREQWQLRANQSTSSNSVQKIPTANTNDTIENIGNTIIQNNSGTNETQENVVQIVVLGSGSDNGAIDINGGEELSSPPLLDSPETAAETFAKQNQCTLKKNTKLAPQSPMQSSSLIAITSPLVERKYVQIPPALNLSGTSTFKTPPPPRPKPPLHKKPTISTTGPTTVPSVQQPLQQDHLAA